MCNICGSTPCRPGCPNSDEFVVGECANCYWEITAGFEYWRDYSGNIFCCNDCAEEYYGIKRVDFERE